MFFVNQFSYSGGKQLISPKKVYCIDTGLRNAVSFKFSADIGRAIENLVFIELKRRSSDSAEIYYWKNKGEVDFVIKEGLRVKELIQVCYSMDEKTEEREVRSLIKAMDEFKLKEGLVITEDLDKEVEVDNKKVVYKPLWMWLLEG
ncbi:MAG: DUF4143 domain-containing protein, partial [Candidatus Methanospirareceae archaeon]